VSRFKWIAIAGITAIAVLVGWASQSGPVSQAEIQYRPRTN
jgi:hypothetical protein